MAGEDLYGLLYGDEPTAQESARAMAAALRGQRDAAGGSQAMGMLASMGQNPVLSQLAPAAFRASEQDSQASGQLGQQFLGALGQRRKATGKQLRRGPGGELISYDPVTGETEVLEGPASKIFNTKGGETVSFDPSTGEAKTLRKAALPAAGGGVGGSTKGAAALDKGLGLLRSDLDPSLGRSGLFGKDQALTTAADKVLALVNGPNGPNYNLTLRQMPELVQSVASMLSNGGQAAQGQLEHLMPHTRGMDWAAKLEYLTNHPEEANSPEFVKQYAETAQRERKLAQQRIRGVQLSRLPAHAGLYGMSPTEAKALARQYLPDLSEEDLDAAFKGQAAKAKASPETGGSPTHYLVSPDGKMRIPAGADGKPLAGAKPEPNPQPAAVATNG